MTSPISITGLRKSFGGTAALDGLEMTVGTGQVHGFLGPNGAGKSTTIRILLGLVRADAGAVRVLGQDPWESPARLHRRLAYVPGDVSLWPDLSGGEIIDLLGRLRGGTDPKRQAELIERFELDPGKKARAYSTGNRQKVALIAAFAADVDLLVLDEPTAGLDPLMEAVFQDCVRERRQAGATVLLSSHLLSEVEQLCDQVTIVRAGRTVEAGALSALRTLTLTSLRARLRTVPPDLERWAGVHDVVVEGPRVELSVEAARLGEVVSAFGAAGLEELAAQPPTLEELFLGHYGHGRSPRDSSPRAGGPAQEAAR